MGKIKSISLIGSGNVATHLGIALFEAGLKVDSVYSRNIDHAKLLGKILNSRFVDKIADISYDSDLYLISVNDNAVKDITKRLSDILGYNILVVHTSGMVSSEIFKADFNNYGVFYPLQTFRKKRKIDIVEVPFLITANSTDIENKLYELASRISNSVNFMSDSKRKALHVAAVFVNNFTNFMYSLSEEIVGKEKIDFDLLKPLIKETAMKVYEGEIPSQIQTGPAIRNDHNTINSHLDYLENNQVAKEIYEVITKSIVEKTK